jgi:hypothetical protein
MSDNIIIMDFDEGIRKRKMVREYDQDRQISDKIIIMKLMSNAHRAPVQIIHTGSGIYHSKKSCNKKEIEKANCEPRIRTKSPCCDRSMLKYFPFN